jgi:hypothetical protein
LKKFQEQTVVFLIITSILLIPSVAADILPPPSFESQGINIITSAYVVGSFSNTADLNWALSSEVLGANLNLTDILWDPDTGLPVIDPDTGEFIEIWELEPEPPLKYDAASWEVQMRTVYSEDTIAPNGVIEYSKTSGIETKALPASMYNIENERLITYEAFNGDQIYSKEFLMIDTVGTPGVNCTHSTACVFPCSGCGCEGCYPAFCNHVETGSTIDMSIVSASSSARLRNVNELGGEGQGEDERWPLIPSVDNPARLHYNVRVDEVSANQSSVGKVSAYLELGVMEGSKECPGMGLAIEEIQVKDSKSVDGIVSLFDHVIDYESGIRR